MRIGNKTHRRKNLDVKDKDRANSSQSNELALPNLILCATDSKFMCRSNGKVHCLEGSD